MHCGFPQNKCRPSGIRSDRYHDDKCHMAWMMCAPPGRGLRLARAKSNDASKLLRPLGQEDCNIPNALAAL